MNKPLVFFVDIDNILLDTDRIKTEIKQALIKVLGHGEANHFWKQHDGLSTNQRLVDFPRIIEDYCKEKHSDSCDIKLKNIFFIIDFKTALYPTAIATLKHLKTLGKVAVVTEGDILYQRRKVEQLGLKKVVDKIYLYMHKSDHMNELFAKWDGYIKIIINVQSAKCIKIKKQYPNTRIIEMCPGHYSDKDHITHQRMDMTIESIADLLEMQQEKFLKKQ